MSQGASNKSNQSAGDALKRVGATGGVVGKLIETAGPADLLRLVELYKEARVVEAKAAVAGTAIQSAKDVALATLSLRAQILDTIARQRLDATDRSIDALIEKMRDADDPVLIAALAQALAGVAVQDQLSGIAALVSAAGAGQETGPDIELDLKF